ncbi:MAG TPA: porphobilinogen synthase [Ktedonobacterales bacterium]|nr:porphobilinogen synthase [Ktedonobacterales bacterium]
MTTTTSGSGTASTASADVTPRTPHVAGGFPARRMRRLRRSESLRRLTRETALDPADFIFPLFVSEVISEPLAISSMPGQCQWPVGAMARQAEELAQLGIGAALLFGVPAQKDEIGSSAWDARGPVQRAIRAMKAAVPELVIVTDVCLCEYTSHGHCGLVRDGEVQNDETLELLAREALSHVEAGADIVAPSDMMDGRVAALREALDGAGLSATPIMAYAAKFASVFYGPFREAAESAPQFGDRRAYQMDPANGREAQREIALDIQEGADIVMVKPALPYLDVLARARDQFDVPLAAYNVSGEYAMLKAAAANGWLDERRATLETLTGIKRAGADLIITYHAIEAARWLTEQSQG